jgi:DNA-damage-inducible protein D
MATESLPKEAVRDDKRPNEGSMTDENLPQVAARGIEGLKKVDAFGAEYWCARDLQPLLGYAQSWRFENAIKKAVTSCEQSGNDSSHHFARARKMVEIGSEASHDVPDYHLSRFACYLIAQNGGNPRSRPLMRSQFATASKRSLGNSPKT